MKLIALNHRTAGVEGHRYNEALGLIDESRRRGWDLDLLLSVRATALVLDSLAPYARPVLDDPTFDFSRTFEERVDEFVRQLRVHAEPALTADSRVLVTIATQCEACALARWARTLPDETMPSFRLLFLSDRWNRAGARPDETAEIEAAGRELALLPPATRARFVLCAITAQLAAELSERMSTAVFPATIHSNYHGLAEVAQERLTRPLPSAPAIAILGGARAEKGSHLVPEIVAASRTRVPVRFIVQAYKEGLEGEAFERLRELAADPDVRLIDRGVDRESYERLLADTNVLLLPYERLNYRQRNSGIMAEGIAAGLPSIVPSSTWMGDQIEAGRASGIVYTGDTPEAIAEAVQRCVADLPALTHAAAALATPWRESQSLGACLDEMERLSSAQDSIHPRHPEPVEG